MPIAGAFAAHSTGASSLQDYAVRFSPSFVTYPQDFSTLSSNVVLTSQNGFSEIVNLSYHWYNGSSDLFVSLINPIIPAGGSDSELIKILSSPLPHTGCCALLGVTATSGSHSHSANLTIAIPSGPDFSLSPMSHSMQIMPGTHASSLVTVTSTDSAGGRVFFPPAVLKAQTFFSGGWSFYLDEVWLVPGGTGSLEFQVYAASDASTGDYVFNVTGSSFSHSHWTSITVRVVERIVGDFSLDLNPNVLIMNSNSTSHADILLKSLNNFTGVVHLFPLEVSQCCPGPITSDPFGPKPSVSPNVVSLTANGSANSVLTINALYPYIHGNYTIDILAYSTSVSHTFNLTVTIPPVPDLFIIEASPPSLTITPGTSINCTLVLSSDYGFIGTVNLSTTSHSESINSTVSLSSVSLRTQSGSRPSASSVLKISTSPSTNPGTYTVTVRGVSGAYMHSTSIKVNVPPSPESSKQSTSSSTILSWPVTIFLGLVGGSGVALILAISLMVRSSRKKQPY